MFQQSLCMNISKQRQFLWQLNIIIQKYQDNKLCLTSIPTLTSSLTQEPEDVLSQLLLQQMQKCKQKLSWEQSHKFLYQLPSSSPGTADKQETTCRTIYLQPGRAKGTDMGSLGPGGSKAKALRHLRSCWSAAPMPTPALQEECQALTWVYSPACWQLFLNRLSIGRVVGWTRSFATVVGFDHLTLHKL